MSAYYERWCEEHGYYDADVDGDQECEECVKEGKTPLQIAERKVRNFVSWIDSKHPEDWRNGLWEHLDLK